jgi:hypothetical protein
MRLPTGGCRPEGGAQRARWRRRWPAHGRAPKPVRAVSLSERSPPPSRHALPPPHVWQQPSSRPGLRSQPRHPAHSPPGRPPTVGASFFTPASRRPMSKEGSRDRIVVIADAASVLPNTRSLMSCAARRGARGAGAGKRKGAGLQRGQPGFPLAGSALFAAAPLAAAAPARSGPWPVFPRPHHRRRLAGACNRARPAQEAAPPARAPPLCGPRGCHSSRSGP